MNTASQKKMAVLELKVNNHPGVMSHVCGLFARRTYNVEGILCLPMQDAAHSKIWLLVDENDRLEQMIQQTLKLVDVLHVSQHSADRGVFFKLEQSLENAKLPVVALQC